MKKENELYYLLNSLLGAMQSREEEKPIDSKKKENPWPWPIHDKCKNFELPDKKAVVIKNEIHCCPEKKHEWEKEEDPPKHDGWISEENPHKSKSWTSDEEFSSSSDPFTSGSALRRHDEDAFAYLFLLFALATTVVPGADVPLNTAAVLDDVRFVPPAAIIEKAGFYDVYYSVILTTAATAATNVALAVNGVPKADSFILIPTGGLGEFSGNTIEFFNRGDVVTIRNVPGGTAIVLAAAPSVGAQLKLNLIDASNCANIKA